jgi:hypothetical protein
MNLLVRTLVVIQGRQPLTTHLRKLAEDSRAIFAPSPRHRSVENGASRAPNRLFAGSIPGVSSAKRSPPPTGEGMLVW